MARLPDSFVDDLLARTDLVALIGERLILKKAGKEHQARCPFHEDKTASFTVSPAKGFYHCFGCGAHGTALKWLMEQEGMTFREAAEFLARRVGLSMPAPPAERPLAGGDDTAQLLAACHRASEYFQEQLAADLGAQEYLLERGIDAATAERFGIGFAPDSWDGLRKALANFRRDVLLRAGLLSQADSGHAYDKFRGRLMFPIHDRRGRVIAFGGRAIAAGVTPKYLNSPETPLFQKGRELYGLAQALQASAADEAGFIVVEGYTDVAALAQAGITGVVGTLGTAVTSDHLATLFSNTDDVLFCFDGDDAGRRAAWKALEIALPHMQDGRQAAFVFLPDDHDPDSLVRAEGAEAFRARLANDAQPLSKFLFEQLAKGLQMDRLEGRARLAQRAAPLIDRIPAGVFRELMRARLAELTGVPAPAQAEAPDFARRTPVRQAIALLLHSPQLAGQLPVSPAFRRVNRPGAALLAEILELATSEPDATTDSILEHFTGREELAHLERLAEAELADGMDVQLAELREALGKLDRFARRRRIELLHLQDELSPEETAELKDLLRFDRDARRRHPQGPARLAPSATRH